MKIGAARLGIKPIRQITIKPNVVRPVGYSTANVPINVRPVGYSTASVIKPGVSVTPEGYSKPPEVKIPTFSVGGGSSVKPLNLPSDLIIPKDDLEPGVDVPTKTIPEWALIAGAVAIAYLVLK